MAPKRKMEITVVDESERVLFKMFQNVFNNLSQFYSLSVNQQKLAFEAGKVYAILKFQEWMAAKLQEGKMATMPEIMAYLQNKLGEEEAGTSANGMQAEVAAASSSALNNHQTKDGHQADMQMDMTN